MIADDSTTTASASMTDSPWHVPGKWRAVPAYWEEADLVRLRSNRPGRIAFIDCTMAEGEHAAGCHLYSVTRVELAEKLAELGVDKITVPSSCSFRESQDFVRSYRSKNLPAALAWKGPGLRFPLRGGWKDTVSRALSLGTEEIHPIFGWSFRDTLTDFGGEISKEQVQDGIREVVGYIKDERPEVRIVPWMVDMVRHHLPTVLQFVRTMVEAGVSGFYAVDSRGNCHPSAAWYIASRLKEVLGDRDLYFQFHNDLGMATANAVMAVEGGANVIDASLLGLGDRGGCAALEEVACALTIYGVETGIKLDRVYEVCQWVEKAFAVQTQIWKPIVGAAWNKEEGWGHREAGDPPETPIGIAGEVVGRPFESVIGGHVFYGRYIEFIKDALEEWGYVYTPQDLDEVVERAKAAVISQRYIGVDDFRRICEGVLGR